MESQEKNTNTLDSFEKLKQILLTEDQQKISEVEKELENLREQLKDKEHLSLIFQFNKSNLYLKNNNYRNLLDYIARMPLSPQHRKSNSDHFEVEIYGHSCGLSDRTLFKQIFAQEDCKRIRIFHYQGEEDFFNKTIEISRHFDDPVLFRSRVNHYHSDDIVPQL